jgi:hypothetical protein
MIVGVMCLVGFSVMMRGSFEMMSGFLMMIML